MTQPAVTVGGAMRVRLLASLLAASHDFGARAWRDRAPDGATFPYLTFVDPVSRVPTLMGDRRALARYTLIEWHLWQKRNEEDDVIRIVMENTLDGMTLTAAELAGPRAFTTRLRQTIRIPDPDRSVVHHSFTVSLAHRSNA